MFSRLVGAIYNAVDVFAPPLPLQEEFIQHWETVANFYTDKRSCGKTPIEATSIPRDLNQMLFLIEQERNEFDSDTPGPCMEYMLQHKILDTMCVLARADTPPGMKRHVLTFVSTLLEQSRYDLLPHINVYLVMKNLITLCGENLATPSEKEEMTFISIICKKLFENPHLVNCFLNEVTTNKNGVSKSVYQERKNSPGHSKSQKLVQFPLIQSLLVLLQSPDSEVVDQASECLTMCVSFKNEKVVKAIVNSNFSVFIINHLRSLYEVIPKNLKPADIDDALSGGDSRMSPNQRKLLCFFKWIEFLKNISESSEDAIAEDISNCFLSDFLENVLHHDLIYEESKVAVFATAMLSGCYCHVTPSPLSNVLSSFLVGDIQEPEIPEFVSHNLKDILVKRCVDVVKSPMLGMTTLQLMEDLIRKPNDIILNSLLINNLRSRKYYDATMADDYFSDEDSEAFASHYLNQEFDPETPSTGENKNVFAPNHINKILNCFLHLLPDEIKSCNTSNEAESGYDIYVKEAHRQFQECVFSCEKCDMPIQPLQADLNLSDLSESESSSQPEADATEPFFFEGSFLNMIFDKLEQMVYQPYEVNLQVTSLVSKLALIPHPNLHEYLLNPFIPLAPNARSLFTVLLKVVEDIQVAVQNVPNFMSDLQRMRRVLLSEDCEDNAQFDSPRTLEAIIVLEEFCKELAAITFVKYHAAS